ncbi:MAG TPA: hypothetical protein VGO93_19040 [Candidatus Xenobia bacterium]
MLKPLVEKGLQGMVRSTRFRVADRSALKWDDGGGLADTPVLLEALREAERDGWSRWIVEGHRSLGGLSPRQAATRPECQRRLRALMDEMAWMKRRQPEMLDILEDVRQKLATVPQDESAALEAEPVEAAGVSVEAIGLDGQPKRLDLPFPLFTQQQALLAALMRYTILSEADLMRLTGSVRVAGAMSDLMDRLARHNLLVVRQEGTGPEGNVYRFIDPDKRLH